MVLRELYETVIARSMVRGMSPHSLQRGILRRSYNTRATRQTRNSFTRHYGRLYRSAWTTGESIVDSQIELATRLKSGRVLPTIAEPSKVHTIVERMMLMDREHSTPDVRFSPKS